MLKTMVDYDVMFYVMGVVALIGVGSRMFSQIALRGILRAAGNMNKSTHKLMKLMRAKFEHACMVSDRVQNVNAFVEKYVFEYRFLGLRLHTWQHLQRQAMWACAVLGGIGAGMYYAVYGMGESVYQYVGVGAVLMTLLFLLRVTTDEKFLLKSAQVYMVDYLENVCAHRYEKMNQRENAMRAVTGTAVSGADLPGAAGMTAEAAGADIDRTAGFVSAAKPGNYVNQNNTEESRSGRFRKSSGSQIEQDAALLREAAGVEPDKKKRRELRREAKAKPEGQRKHRLGRKAPEPEQVFGFGRMDEEPDAARQAAYPAGELRQAMAVQSDIAGQKDVEGQKGAAGHADASGHAGTGNKDIANKDIANSNAVKTALKVEAGQTTAGQSVPEKLMPEKTGAGKQQTAFASGFDTTAQEDGSGQKEALIREILEEFLAQRT